MKRSRAQRIVLGLASAPLVVGVCVASWVTAPVFAQVPPAPPTGKINGSCVETIPSGATRPDITETFPDDGFSGYAATLELTVKHGKGETVLPNGFKVQSATEAYRALDRAGFAIPYVDGGSGPTLETKPEGDGAITKVKLPILLLPPNPGRNTLTLPALPISVSRANGAVMTLCTQPHTIVVEDPIANENDPKVKPNPSARHQKEEWKFLEYLLLGILGGLLVGLLLGYLIWKWLRRPKPVVVVPKRVPWLLALEELEELRHSPLLTEGRKAEFYDKVSDCVRKYLGSRYGFDNLGIDGLDTTSDEMRALLKRVRPPIRSLDAISEFLADCDLVKFARMTPSEVECLAAVIKSEAIIRATMPAERKPGQPAAPISGVAPEGPPGPSAPPGPPPTPPAPPAPPAPQTPPDAAPDAPPAPPEAPPAPPDAAPAPPAAPDGPPGPGTALSPVEAAHRAPDAAAHSTAKTTTPEVRP